MATNCNELNKDFLSSADCYLPKGGLSKRVILINFADIDFSNVTIADGQVTAFALKSGKRGYEFTSKEDSQVASFTMERGTYVATYSHSVTLRDFAGGKDGYLFTQQLANSRVVAIVENIDWGANKQSKYTIYGLEAGMMMTSDTGTTDREDGVFATIELTTSERSMEATRPIDLFTTSIDATDTLVNGLIATT